MTLRYLPGQTHQLPRHNQPMAGYLPEHFLLDLVAADAPDLQLVRRLDNPAVFADMDPQRALKVMWFGASA